MTEPTRAFFTKLGEQHQPTLQSLTGTVRFDIADGERTEHWYLHIGKGDVTVSHDDARGRLRDQRRHRHVRRDPLRPHERHGRRAARRRRHRGQGHPAHRAAAPVPRRERGAPPSHPPATRGGSHERRGQDPRRQHLRRERRGRGHRGLAHGSHRAVRLRHPLPLQVGAHRGRPAAQPAVGGRSAVLRDPVLPRAGHRDRLHRRQAVGDPPARRGRGLPRGAHDPQPRRDARRPGGAHRGRLGLRRPLRGQGRPARRRASTTPGWTTAAWCSGTSARPTCARPGCRRRRPAPWTSTGSRSRSTWSPTASGPPTST